MKCFHLSIGMWLITEILLCNAVVISMRAYVNLHLCKIKFLNQFIGSSLVVQLIRVCLSTAKGAGPIIGLGTKISHAT